MLGIMTTAFVALGSNIGKRQTALRAALARIARLPGTQILAVASFRETAPVDCPPGMRAFINTAAKIETALGAVELLGQLQRIERELGRERSATARHQARTIDLDLLLYGECALSLPELELPHPRMHERLFVLEPLAEIAPECRHPILGQTALQMRRAAEARLAAEGVAG